MSSNYKIAILPGDGIGPEVMKQAIKILDLICKKFKLNIKYKEYHIGGSAIEKYGNPFPEKTLKGCKNSDAILFGSIGGPKWKNLDLKKQPETGALLPIRKYFNLFANLRPITLYRGLENSSPLNLNILKKRFDILCVRELTGGIYFGKPKGEKGKGINKCAFDTEIYYKFEIERISHIAFKFAKKRSFKVTSIDKSNVLKSSILWRNVVNKISEQYPEVKLDHMYIDNAIMQLIKIPSKFDVILCSNLFGDILSDACAAISGSIGLLPSASLNENNFGLYEPAGGSAPEIAGKNIANPIAQILSLALLFRYSLKKEKIANLIENSVKSVLQNGIRTFDLYGKKEAISTDEMGSAILELII